jgi:hypothetical protein
MAKSPSLVLALCCALALAATCVPPASAQSKPKASDQLKKANEGTKARNHVFDGTKAPPNAVRATPRAEAESGRSADPLDSRKSRLQAGGPAPSHHPSSLARYSALFVDIGVALVDHRDVVQFNAEEKVTAATAR